MSILVQKKSSLGEGWELDSRRGEGRGIFRGNVEGGVTGRSGSTSLSVISVCCGLARERADRKAAEAGVAYWLLPRENPEEGESDGCPVPMGVATCRAVSETDPPAGPKRDRYGEGIVRGVSLVGQAGLGVVFFLPRVSFLMVGDRWVR